MSTSCLSIVEISKRGKPKTLPNGQIRIIGSVMLPVLDDVGQVVGHRRGIRGTGRTIGGQGRRAGPG